MAKKKTGPLWKRVLNKKDLAHLESQNDVALETIKQISEAMENLTTLTIDDDLEKIEKALEWFKKYGSVEK